MNIYYGKPHVIANRMKLSPDGRHVQLHIVPKLFPSISKMLGSYIFNDSYWETIGGIYHYPDFFLNLCGIPLGYK